MASEDQLLEALLLTREWNKNIVDQLNMIINADEDTNFMVESESGTEGRIPVDKKDIKGLKYGIINAKGMIEKFPVKISNNDNED